MFSWTGFKLGSRAFCVFLSWGLHYESSASSSPPHAPSPAGAPAAHTSSAPAGPAGHAVPAFPTAASRQQAARVERRHPPQQWGALWPAAGHSWRLARGVGPWRRRGRGRLCSRRRSSPGAGRRRRQCGARCRRGQRPGTAGRPGEAAGEQERGPVLQHTGPGRRPSWDRARRRTAAARTRCGPAGRGSDSRSSSRSGAAPPFQPCAGAGTLC